MADFNEIKISYRIRNFIDIYKKCPQEVYVFGLNGHIGRILHFLTNAKINITAIFDNNPEKQNKNYDGIPIIKPEIGSESESYVVIASAYYEEMKDQLIYLGYDETHIFDLLRGNASNERDLVDEDIIYAECSKALAGEKILDKIHTEYGYECNVFLAPVGSVGDIYLFCLYFEQFLKEKEIENYVLAIPGKSGNKIARMYGYRSTHISQDEADELVKYRMIMGTNISKIYVLHCGYLHTRIPCYMLMYKKMTWIENYRSVLFELNDEKKKKIDWPVPTDEVLANLRRMGFEQGKSVILSPYANTLADLDLGFWEKMADELKKMGIKCFTNVTPNEKEIAGTERLEVGIEYIFKIVELAGYFIALRSGLCDIVSGADCRKIILYTQECFETIKVIEFYSLKRMGLCDNAYEIEMTYNWDFDAKKVMECL